MRLMEHKAAKSVLSFTSTGLFPGSRGLEGELLVTQSRQLSDESQLPRAEM